MRLMLNETIDGIAQKLNKVFGDGYEIYIDEVKQGLKEPCFLIVCITGNQQQKLGTLYNREQSFDLHYFPKTKQITREVNSVIAVLNMELEYITVDGNLVRGTKMRHEVIGGVLHFFVNYDMRIRKVVEPDPLMEDLTIIERVKTDGN
jgi:hypothetical protein